MGGSGEKTEQPTPKKLQDARKKGQVAKSPDVSAAAVFVSGFAALTFVLPEFGERMRAFMSHCFGQAGLDAEDGVGAAFDVLGRGGELIMAVSVPVMAVMFTLALAVAYLQVGPLFAFQALKPDLKRLNPIEGFKNKFFKASTYIEFGKNLIKIVLVTALVVFLLWSNLRYVVLTARLPLWESSLLVGQLLFRMSAQMAVLFLAIAAADFFIQKKQFMKEMKMTKEEVKQEFKQSEGDPTTKGMRQQLHQEILTHNMVEDVRNADVVVINPEHIAVAIRYDRETMAAPQVAAKGHDQLAHKIVEVARQFGVPVLRNIPLARTLDELDIGDQIPESLYEAVAEVLNWVYRLSGREEGDD